MFAELGALVANCIRRGMLFGCLVGWHAVYWWAGSRQYACHLTPDTCSLFSMLYPLLRHVRYSLFSIFAHSPLYSVPYFSLLCSTYALSTEECTQYIGCMVDSTAVQQRSRQQSASSRDTDGRRRNKIFISGRPHNNGGRHKQQQQRCSA